jgi:hypothetical protein
MSREKYTISAEAAKELMQSEESKIMRSSHEKSIIQGKHARNASHSDAGGGKGAENKEDKAAPFGIGSLLSSPAEPQPKAKKAKNAEAETSEATEAAAPVVEEAAVSQDAPKVSSDAETA